MSPLEKEKTTTMNKITFSILSALLICFMLISPQSVIAQTATTTTTLSTAITSTTTTTVTLASATNVAAGGFLYILDPGSIGEVLTVNTSYVSGTTIPVRRGASGTRASLHGTTAIVYVAQPGNMGRTVLRDNRPQGACTATNEPYLPVVFVPAGEVWNCNNSIWTGVQGPAPTMHIWDGTTSTAAGTGIGSRVIVHSGTVALASASPSTVTVTGFSPAFTSTSTFSCFASPTGATAAIAAAGVAVTLASSSSVTFTGPNTVTTVINYSCIGY
jgi:hypothetical protein